MRKLWFSMILLAAVLMSACGPRTTPAANPTKEPEASLPTENPSLPKMECTVVSVAPTPGPTEVAIFPPAGADDWVKGKPTAAMTITEYSDFQCPYCAQFSTVLHQLAEAYPEDVQIVFRHFPLPSHPLALSGAYAAEAAGRQGKFWELEERLYAQQATWTGFSEEQFVEWVSGQAKELGLDVTKFQQDMKDPAVVTKVKAAQQHALDIGIPGTPFVLINGRPYNDAPRDFANLGAIAQMLRLSDRQISYCPPMEIDPAKQYIATIKTEKGDIRVQLLPDKAPMAVNSFVFLARYGWYDNVPFFLVQPDLVAMSGDPAGTGYGSPGYNFANEITDLKFDKEGKLAMYNEGPGSNGSTFFITYSAKAELDGKYTIFGEVIDGMDVARKLTARNPQQGGDVPDADMILTITIEEK